MMLLKQEGRKDFVVWHNWQVDDICQKQHQYPPLRHLQGNDVYISY